MVGQPPTCNRCIILHFETSYLLHVYISTFLNNIWDILELFIKWLRGQQPFLSLSPDPSIQIIISHNQESCPIIIYLICERLKAKPRTVMRGSLLSVPHPPLHMVKLQEPILQNMWEEWFILALFTFPSRVWVPCPCRLSRLVSQPSSVLFPVNVRIP